jgi:8-oxo-dGTP pyrophosphatase MutT (NUDIX family)
MTSEAPVPSGALSILAVGDPGLAPSRDPDRARRRLRDASLVPGQDAERQRVLALLDEHAAGLSDRSTTPGHLTGSALVVDSSGRRVLLLLHTKLGRWLQPGGHADGDCELAGVALREATEETGIDGLRVVLPAVDLDVHTVDHGDELGRHLHLDLRFVVLAPAGAVPVGNHESRGLRWVDLDELEATADEVGLVRLARVGLAVAARALALPGD